MIACGISECGKRAHNEDAYLIQCDDPNFALVAVSDGMGGHAAGEVASAMIIEALSESFEAFDRDADDRALKQLLSEVIVRAGARVFEDAEVNPEREGMGATLVAAILKPDRVIWASCGDSRIYDFADGELRQITTDHSYVQGLIDAGRINEQEALVHPYRNIITRALGLDAMTAPDSGSFEWSKGDILLLCSDGLCGVTLNKNLCVCIRRGAKNLDKLMKRLVKLAYDCGSTDNITVVLAANEGGEDIGI
ncbi:MAG TPA: Stp1/IreP family PP2C-type Ser/Thr phosphatase [Eubacteriales bacterium]|nr:Stp1/IreP family PP2C-type Ser/Thr phosphatase [Eubacteriales bacterium]